MADIQKRLGCRRVSGGMSATAMSRPATQEVVRTKGRRQRFAASVETDLIRGDWIDPDRGRELFSDSADKWLATTWDRKPKTRGDVRVDRASASPFRGSAKAPISAIDYPTVLTFVAELRQAGVAAKTVRNIRDVLRSIFKLAVRSGALKSNPVVDVPVARTHRTEMVFLEPDQIMDLAGEVAEPPARTDAASDESTATRSTGCSSASPRSPGSGQASWSGFGSRTALMKRRVYVHQSASEAYGKLQIVATKTYERRSVAIPRSFGRRTRRAGRRQASG